MQDPSLLLLAAALLASPGVPFAPPAPAPPAKQSAPTPSITAEERVLGADIEILQRLDRPFAEPKSFRDVAAREIVDAVRRESGMPIEIDRRALGEGWAFQRVDADPTTMRDALEAVRRAVSSSVTTVEIEVASGIVVLTDASGRERLAVRASYSLEGLLTRLARAGDGGMELAKEELSTYLQSIDVENWTDTGGTLSSLSFTGSVATIRTSPGMHLRIRQALEVLSRELPAPVLQWSIRVVELGADLDDAAVDSAVADRIAVDALVGSARTAAPKDAANPAPRAWVVCAPRILARRNEPAGVEIGSDAGSISVEVARAGEDSEAFVVRFRERSAGGSERRLVLRALPGVRAAGVLEGGGRRLLLEVEGISESAARVLEAARRAAEGGPENEEAPNGGAESRTGKVPSNEP